MKVATESATLQQSATLAAQGLIQSCVQVLEILQRVEVSCAPKRNILQVSTDSKLQNCQLTDSSSVARNTLDKHDWVMLSRRMIGPHIAPNGLCHLCTV